MGSIPQLSVIKGVQREHKSQLLHRIFEENVSKTCDDLPALIYSECYTNEKLITTYKQLNRKSNQLASQLLQDIAINKLTPNQDNDFIIAVCMEPSDALLNTLLAVWKCGAAYLPIDVTFPQNRIDHILSEAQPLLVVIESNLDKNFRETKCVTYNDLSLRSQDKSDENICDKLTLNCGKNELALVLYTSGSTGIPKGVRLQHKTILNRLKWQWEMFPYSASEKVGVFKTALTFVDSVSELWGPLLNDMAVLIVPKSITKDPAQLVNILEEYKIERLVLVPTLLRSLLMYLPLKSKSMANKPLYNLKNWICSGESLAVSLAKEFFDYFEEGFHKLYNFYGSTEVMGDVTYFVCEGKHQLENFEKVPIGYPINNTVIYILDTDYRPVKLGETGELFVAGLNLAQGYVNGRDAIKFVENPLAIDPKYERLYRTGDYASCLKGGCIQYEGRTDSQIKVRGHRVDLSEIERNLLQLNGIDRGIVLCYHAGEIDQALLAFVTIYPNTKVNNGLQIETLLGDYLAPYMIPQVIIVDQIPMLVNGKIDRQSLLKSYENTNNNDDSIVELDFDYTNIPNHLMEMARDVFETIGKVIGRSTRTTLSMDSNFYELGGNSLNSIYTVTLLHEKGYNIGITEFIMATNLGEILQTINNTSNTQAIESQSNMNLKSIPLEIQHKNDTIEIITTSFYEKADLEQWLKPNIRFTDYGDILEEIWTTLVAEDLSFIVKDNENRVIAVALNFDARNEPEVAVKSKLIIVFEFLEFVEGPIRDEQLPSGKQQILHSFMMGTSSSLSAQENISVMHFMENEVLKLAKRKQYAGILTTNTNPLTQQLGSSVYGYKTMLDYQVNQYVYSDGSKPFGKAPDNQRAIVHWKDIRGLN